MSTRQISTSFLVEPTKYGWSVCTGTKRLGLFNTQRQALEDVKDFAASCAPGVNAAPWW